MADAQPLNTRLPIAKGDGTPTEFFIRWAQQFNESALGPDSLTEIQQELLNLGSAISNLALNNLTDVDTETTPPEDGQALVYDEDSGLWLPGDVASGGGGGGGGAPWEVVATWDHAISGNTNRVVFNNLHDYTDLYVFIQDMTLDTSVQRYVRVSTDNGATWFEGSSDWAAVASSGVVTSPTGGSALNDDTSSAARSGDFLLLGSNLQGPKFITRPIRGNTRHLFLGSEDPINALSVTGQTPATQLITGGKVWVYGRKATGGGGGSNLTPPSVTDFPTVVNDGGVFTATDTEVGLTCAIVPGGSGTQLRLIAKSYPVAPFEVVFKLDAMTDGASGDGGGLMIYDSVGGRLIKFGIEFATSGALGPIVQRWNSLSSFGATLAGGVGFAAGGFFKLEDDGTNYRFYFGPTKTGPWALLYTYPKATWIPSPTHIGFGIEDQNIDNVFLLVGHYDQQ